MGTKIILCLNGEHTTAINRRLMLLENGYIIDLEEELLFINAISLKFKKSSAIWFYREKIVLKILEIGIYDSESLF